MEPLREGKARLSASQLEALLRQTYANFAGYAALAPRSRSTSLSSFCSTSSVSCRAMILARKTYIGAMPGRIVNAISQSGSMNPLLLLDEIDKMGSG